MASGLINGAFGVSPDYLIGPVIIHIGVNRVISRTTVLYVTIFATLASSIVAMVEDLIQQDYTVLLAFMTVFGTLPGMAIQYQIIKYTQRNSYIIMIFTFCMLFCMISIPSFEIDAVVQNIRTFN